MIHADIGFLFIESECVVTMHSRSGLRVTGPTGAQLRVRPDHRAGWRSNIPTFSSTAMTINKCGLVTNFGMSEC